jgi:hypothetical protein
LKFPVSVSVYPLGKRTHVLHYRVFSIGLGILPVDGAGVTNTKRFVTATASMPAYVGFFQGVHNAR